MTYLATSNNISSSSADVITTKPCQGFEMCPLIQQSQSVHQSVILKIYAFHKVGKGIY